MIFWKISRSSSLRILNLLSESWLLLILTLLHIRLVVGSCSLRSTYSSAYIEAVLKGSSISRLFLVVMQILSWWPTSSWFNIIIFSIAKMTLLLISVSLLIVVIIKALTSIWTLFPLVASGLILRVKTSSEWFLITELLVVIVRSSISVAAVVLLLFNKAKVAMLLLSLRTSVLTLVTLSVRVVVVSVFLVIAFATGLLLFVVVLVWHRSDILQSWRIFKFN